MSVIYIIYAVVQVILFCTLVYHFYRFAVAYFEAISGAIDFPMVNFFKMYRLLFLDEEPHLKGLRTVMRRSFLFAASAGAVATLLAVYVEPLLAP